MSHFEITTVLSAPPHQVFDACLDLETHTRSLASTGERVVGGTARGRLTAGQSVTFQARHFGLTWQLTARITSWNPPHSFVDEQETGPFQYWRHAHVFQPHDADGTVMTDIIDFASPRGPLGRLADATVLNRYMPRLIRSRNSYLAAAL